MANVVYELMAVLGLDSKPFEDGLNGAKETAEGGGSKIGSALGGIAKTAGVALAAASTAAVAFGKTAVDASISYESAFTGVTKTVEETATTSYDMLSDAIMKMATETASSKEVIAGVMEAAGQLGISADDIVGFTETMIQLGDTTNLSAEEAAIALARFTNITGLASGDVDKLGSAIVDLGNNFATDEASIVSMSTRLASAGTIAGLSSTDILALSTAMSSVGIEAEAGGTAMTQVLTKIGDAVAKGVDPSNEKLKTFAEVAGMSAESFAEAWNTSPVEALSQFIIGLDGINSSGKNVNAVLDDLGIKGIRETNMIKSLALASDVLTEAVDTASTAFQENSALSDEANKRYGTMESQISQLKEAYSNMKVTIGDELLPTLSNFIEYGKTGMTELTTAFQQDGLEGAINALGPIIDRGVEMLFEVLPRILEAGVALLDALITAIITNLPKLVPAAVQIIKQLVDSISKNIETIMDAAVEIILALADGLIDVLPEMIPAIIEIITTIVDKLTEPDTLAKLIEAALQIIIALAEGLIEALPKLIEKAPEIVGNLFTALLEEGPKIIEAGIELIGKLAEGLIQAIPKAVEAIGQLAERIKQEYEARKDKLIEWGNNLIDNLITGIREKWEDFKQALEEAKAILSKYFGEIIEWFHQKGTEIGEIFTSIKTSFGLVRDWFRDKINEIKNKWTELKDNIREKVDNIKEFFGALKEAFGAVHDWFVEKIEGIKAGWQSLTERISQISDDIKAVCEAIKQAFSDAFDRVTKFIGEDVPNAFNAALDFFQGLPERAFQWGADLLHGFVDGIKQKWSDLKGTLGDFGQTIADWIGFSEPRLGPLSHFHEFAPDMMELFAKGIKDNENLVTAQISKSFDFGGGIMGASPALAAGPTTNTWNITVNGIDELDQLVRWWEGRQVEERMR